MRVDATNLFEKVNIEQTNANALTKESSSTVKSSVAGTEIGRSLFDKVMNNTEVDKSMWGRTDGTLSYEEQIKNQAMQIKNNLKALYNSMSCGDYAAITEDGTDINNMEVKDIVTVVDRIKIMLATYCRHSDYQMDNINVDDIKQVLGSSVNVYSVAKKMEEADIPLTEDNFNDTITAYEMYDKLEPLNREMAGYLVKNELDPTIKNVYIAVNSGAKDDTNTDKNSDEELFKELKSQIVKIIKEAGLKADNNTLSDAKWMLNNDIPVTADNIKKLEDYQKIGINKDKDIIIGELTMAIASGNSPVQYNLLDGNKTYDDIKNAIDVINRTDEIQVINLMMTDREITIKNLAGIIDMPSLDTSDNMEFYKNNEEECKKNYRLLLEAKILMTSKSAMNLAKTGIEIDITPIEELVDKLKQSELDLVNKEATRNDKITIEQLDIYTETNAALYSMRYAPVMITGQIAEGTTPYNIQNIASDGEAMRLAMNNAGKAYETLSTQVRTDLGDSVQKAVDNSAEKILEELSYKDTKYNRRIVSVLAYNNMDITRENFEKVREIDSELNRLMKDMSPETVMSLIKKGINPLTMNIDELSEIVENTTVIEDTAMKFGEFLYKLEKDNTVDKKDRDRYIGIYKAFSVINSTKGKVIGSLLKQNENITLGNIVSAYRTMQKGGIDTTVDDNKGMNENTEKGKYFKNIFKEVSDGLTPEVLKKALSVKNADDITLEELKEIAGDTKSDIEYTKEAYEEYRQVYERLKECDNSVIEQLTLYNIPVTVNNMISVYALNEDYARYYKKIKSQFNNLANAGEAKIQSEIDNILDSADDMKELQKAYKTLDDDVNAYMNKYLNSQETQVNTVDVKSLKLVNNGISIISKWSKNENYVIPYTTNDGDVGAINLKVVRDKEYGGKVTIDINSDKTGHINAYCMCNDTRIQAYITSDSRTTSDNLLESESRLEDNMHELGYKECDIKISFAKKIPTISHAEKSSEKTPTNKLYKVAKTMINTIIETL